METVFIFKKSKILRAAFGAILFVFIGVWFVLEPNKFLMNVYIREHHIIIIGVICAIYFSAVLYSLFMLSGNKVALIVTKDYFIDNTRFESLGKINWIEVDKIKKVKEKYLEITFKNLDLNHRKVSFFKRFLLFMRNWNYRSSIIISNVYLDCTIEEIEKAFLKAFKNG